MSVVPLHRVDGSPAEMSDEALVAACGTGERSALGALYDRHATTIRRFLARLSGTEERDLDDLVQATFEVVVRAAPRFDGRSSVRTWLIGIANNTARHHVRTEVRRRRLREAASAQPQITATGEHGERERLHEAICELPPKLREALVLVYLEGFTGPEAAAAIGVREGTVWKRLHEAREGLRGIMQGGAR
jgi:RNA polymerase sigma-70 factor (ECF subfamily)